MLTCAKQRFSLCESVDAWMTSLRHQVDNYCSHDAINLVYQMKCLPVAAHNSHLAITLHFNIAKYKYHLISDERVVQHLLGHRNSNQDTSIANELSHLTYLNLDVLQSLSTTCSNESRTQLDLAMKRMSSRALAKLAKTSECERQRSTSSQQQQQQQVDFSNIASDLNIRECAETRHKPTTSSVSYQVNTVDNNKTTTVVAKNYQCSLVIKGLDSYINKIFDRISLAVGLNCLLIRYDALLGSFLHYMHNNGEIYRKYYVNLPRSSCILIEKFQRCCLELREHKRASTSETTTTTTLRHESLFNTQKRVVVSVGVVGRLLAVKVNSPTRCCDISDQVEYENTTTGRKKVCHTHCHHCNTAVSNCRRTISEVEENDKKNERIAVNLENSTLESQQANKELFKCTTMTIPYDNESLKFIAEEENIYQPIWQFKTLGEAQESNTCNNAPETSERQDQLILEEEEHVDDYGEWETDDEFMFSVGRRNSTAPNMPGNQTLKSIGSTGSDSTMSSTSLALVMSQSPSYHMFRSVGIFFSVSEPKMRAIKYDYDRINAWRYFVHDSSTSSTRYTISHRSSLGLRGLPESGNVMSMACDKISDSVQAWKFMLLDINYIDDEEDMHVRENELMGIRDIKENFNLTTPAFQSTISRFKSASIGNLVELPSDDEKKSIAERMRNKLSRGVFKLNMRSPKNDKKSRGLFRGTQTTSLYLADGGQPKYPIFGVTLDKMEFNETKHPHVPRFVVDCIHYIEQKDNIRQEGLYRASGNKVWIDELKKILTESCIYDARLLHTDDIHTLTSLLKQFFRQLPEPLIPPHIIELIGRDLSSPNSVPRLRKICSQIAQPNRSTLKFLMQHLTNVAAWSFENRMPASNLAIVWGPCLLSINQFHLDIGRTNTLAKVLIENYSRIFEANERLVF